MLGKYVLAACMNVAIIAAFAAWPGGECGAHPFEPANRSAGLASSSPIDWNQRLFQAVRSNDTKSAIRALDAGANPNARDVFT